VQVAAREMLTVNGISKKQKQKTIMADIRKKVGLIKLAGIAGGLEVG